MERLNSQSGIFRRSTVIFLSFIFCLIASATVIPDDTTIVGDLTIQTTNGIDINPGSDADADLVSVGVTGSPKIKWDESEDAFQVIEKLLLGTNAGLTKTVNASSITSKMSLDTDTTTNSGGIDITRHGSSDPSYGVINMYRSRGTHGSEAVVQSGDLISSIVGLGFDGTDYEPVAAINMYSDGTPGSNDMPGRIDFKTVADGSRVLNQVMRVGQNTDVMIGTTTSEASSIFEVQSVTRGSRPVPRMQQTERNNISSPATGLMAYNTDFNTYDFYNGSGWLNFLDTGTTQEFSGKTVTDSLKFKETGGGSNYSAFQAPSSLTGDVTFTLPDGDGSAGQVLSTNGSGTLSWANGGSGSGGINYLEDNPDAEAGTTGWATYADSAGTSPVDGTGGSATTTWTQTSSSPLRGTYSFLLTKDAANRQGQGASYDFTIAEADKAKVLNIEFEYILSSGTFVAGTSSTDSDVTVWIYDVTNSTLTQPSSYKLLSNSTTISDRFSATFQTASNSTSYRLIFHVGSTSASAYVLKIDDIKIGPSNYIFGSPITDWQAVTPTFTGLGTVTSIEVYSRRNGDNLEIEGNFTTGTTTGTEARISLNYRGANVTSTAIPSIRKAGEMFFSSAAAAVGTMLIEPSVTYLTLGSQNAGNAGLTKQLGTTYASSSKHTFSASVPILGWSSSTQMSDSADTRVVSARAYRSSNQSVSTAAETDIVFNATTFDDVGGFNTSNGINTIQVPGKYVVKTSVYISSAASEVFTLSIYKNGVQTAQRFFTATSDAMVEVSDILNCVAGDTIKSTIDSTADTSYTIIGSSVATFTTIERISGPSAIAASEIIAARYTTTASQSIGAASTVSVYFDSKDFDTHSAVTDSGSTSWTYNALIPGYYRVTMSVVSLANALQQQVYKNGSLYAYLGTTSAAATVPGSTLIQCNAGDKITFQVYNAGGATTLSGNAKANWITIERLGGVM